MAKEKEIVQTEDCRQRTEESGGVGGDGGGERKRS